MIPLSRLMALLIMAGALAAPLALAQKDSAAKPAPSPSGAGTVEGQIEGHPEAATTVMLLQFRLNAEGQPEGGPIGRTETKAGGTYLFKDVPIDPDSVYRLGTRIAGRLVGSDPFTFKQGETRIVFNLRVPDVKSDPSALNARELLWIGEPSPGLLRTTEVLHLENSSQDLIDLERAPLELPIPADARHLEMLRLDLEDGQHERLGAKLLISGRVPPGTHAIAFRYLVPAPFGAVSWTRSYGFPIGALRVLSPNGVVQAEGEGKDRRWWFSCACSDSEFGRVRSTQGEAIADFQAHATGKAVTA